MIDVQKKLKKLYNKLSNEKIKEELFKKAQKLEDSINEKNDYFLINLEELESLVSSEKVEYEDFIGDISIDK
jgi:hypothetical protein